MAAILRSLLLALLALSPAAAETLQDPLPPVHGGTGLRSCTGVPVGSGGAFACGMVPAGWLGGSVPGAGAPVEVTSPSFPIPGPGWYDVQRAGATLTLPDPSAGGPILITDGTYAPNPGIVIWGKVNGRDDGLTISAPGGSWELGPQPASATWRVLAQQGGGVGGTPFAPPAVSGLLLWLDASDASTITTAAGGVSAWLDKSGAGLVAAQATSGNRPAVTTGAAPSGLAGLTFNGTSDALQIPSITLPGSATVFIAGSFASSVGAEGMLIVQGSPSYWSVGGGGDFFVRSMNGSAGVRRSGGVSYTAGAASFSPSLKPSLFDWSISPSAISAYLNSGLMPASGFTPSLSSGSPATDPLNIGASGGSAGMFTSGTVYEILIYGGTLSSANTAAIRSYLAAKWGIYAPTVSALSYSVPLVSEGVLRGSPHAAAVFQTAATALAVDAYDNGGCSALPALCSLGVTVNGAYYATLTPSAGISHLSASLAPGYKTVTIESSLQQTPTIATVSPVTGLCPVAYAFNAPATQIFPEKAKALVVYGDGIAVGKNASPPTQASWVGLLRASWTGTVGEVAWDKRSLYQDVTYRSIAAVVADLQQQAPTQIWLEIGGEDYAQSLWTAAAFGAQYGALLDAIHGAMPAVAIWAQTPTRRSVETANGAGSALADYRAAIASAVSTRTGFATLVDGTALMSATYLDSDGASPTNAGHAMLAAAMQAILPP